MARKDKKLLLYIIKRKSDPSKICAVVTKEDDISEYINTRLLLDNNEHFRAWCSFKNIDIDNNLELCTKSWEEYCDTVLTDEIDDYIVQEYFYTIEGIASIMRMFNHCEPLNCSYESETEHLYYQASLNLIQDSEDNKDISDNKTIC